MTDRFDKLAPRDLAITLRSLGRRFATIEQGTRDPQVATKLDAIGGNGRSLTEVFALAARSAAFLANEIDRSLDHEEPVVAAAALDPTERSFVDDRPLAPANALATIATESERAAARFERAGSNELSRSVSVTGGTSTTPHHLGQEMARTCINLLTEAENLLEALR